MASSTSPCSRGSADGPEPAWRSGSDPKIRRLRWARLAPSATTSTRATRAAHCSCSRCKAEVVDSHRFPLWAGHPVPERNGLRHRVRSEEHTSELQSLAYLVCRLLLEKKN